MKEGIHASIKLVLLFIEEDRIVIERINYYNIGIHLLYEQNSLYGHYSLQ